MSAIRRPLGILALLLAGAAQAQVANDECFTAQPLGVGVTAGSSLGATTSAVTSDCAVGGETGADVWFVWQAPAQGVATASFVNGGGFADFDTVLSAFTGGCTSLVQLACNDDASIATFTLLSQVSFPVLPGQIIFLNVGGWEGDAGDFGLSLSFLPASAPTNDECATALEVGLGVSEATNFFATQSPDAPPCGFGGAIADADVWFHVRAPETGLFTASTGSGGGFADFDSILAVYTGSCGSTQLLGCNDDAFLFTLASEVSVLVQQDQELWISVGGFFGSAGSFGLALSSIAGGPPVHDECSTALPVTSGVVQGLNVFASDSAETATCASLEGTVGRDVWYAWTAPADGLLTATTTISGGGFADFDTIIGLFGGGCDGLVEVACNDDAEDLQSLATAPVVAGETYLIEVGGWNGASGEFLLNLIFAPDHATADIVLAQQKISDTQGGFLGDLSSAFASFGLAVTAVGDLDADGTPDLLVGSPFEHLELVDSGALWVVFLKPDGTVKGSKRLATGQGLPMPTGHTEFGAAVAALGDLDGDGAPEVAVGAPGDDDGGIDRGAVFVLTLAADGSVTHVQKVSDTQGGFNGIVFDLDAMGSSLAAPGDLDGDGITELAVGSPGSDDEDLDSGAVWIWSLGPAGTVHDWQKISNTKGLFTGVLAEGDAFGSGVAGPGDLDLDGVPDLAVGAIGNDDGGAQHGALWTLLMRTDSKVKSSREISSLTGGFEGLLFDGALLGRGLTSPGDLDGDGTGDLFAGAIGDGDGGPFHGAVWVLFLEPDGTVEGHAKISSKKGGFDGPLGNSAFFGEALCAPGDLDGDGHVDLIVGNRFDDDGATDRGALWVLFLDATHPWVLLGHALAGGTGLPLLTGEGPLLGDDEASIHLLGAAPDAPVVVFLGLSEVNLPLLGGTLVPAADMVITGGATDEDGTLDIVGRWPVGVPAGLQAFVQCWIQDPAAPQGWAASNGLQILTH